MSPTEIQIVTGTLTQQIVTARTDTGEERPRNLETRIQIETVTNTARGTDQKKRRGEEKDRQASTVNTETKPRIIRAEIERGNVRTMMTLVMIYIATSALHLPMAVPNHRHGYSLTSGSE